jgi:hypothetical protein
VPDACDACLEGDDRLDDDEDGVPDACDQCPGVIDGLDADGDGTANCLEECPLDPDKLEPGVCGCGLPDEDTDGDDLPDCQLCTISETELIEPRREVPDFVCTNLNDRSPTFEERVTLASLREVVWLAYMGDCG